MTVAMSCHIFWYSRASFLTEGVEGLVIRRGHVPGSFGMSLTVPVPKSNASRYSKSLSVDDFRGISTRPVLSKVFEHCLLIVIVNTSSPVTVSLDLNANRAVRMQFILYDQYGS